MSSTRARPRAGSLRRSRRVLLATATTMLLLVGPGHDHAAAHPLSGHRYWGQAQHDLLGRYSGVNRGDVVGLWQSYLQTLGGLPCSGLDGNFGAQTDQATKNFQTFFGLGSDGLVGYNTWQTASVWLESAGTDGFLTTYWHEESGGWPFALFAYVYSAQWTWMNSVSDPFEEEQSTNHPSITFGRSCP